jgi:hypothetical protein
MNKILRPAVFSTLLLIILSSVMELDDFNSYGWTFFIIQLFFIIYGLNKISTEVIIYLSPSVLTLIYLNLSFGFGHWAVVNNISYERIYNDEYKTFNNPQFITIYLLLCSLIVTFSLIPFLKKIPNLNYSLLMSKKQVNYLDVFVILISVLLLSLIEIDLGLLGGVGNFNYSFQLALTIILTIKLIPVSRVLRFIYYLILIILFLISNYNSKREVLFVIILFLFFELTRSAFKIKINFKTVIFGTLFGLLFFGFIIVSSIARGYGNFNVENPLDAIEYIDDYVDADYFQSVVVGNLEVLTVYGNTANAINYIYEGELEQGYGSTFAKVLFIPVPRSIFPDKPQSMIDIYTTKFKPSFREKSGSLPVTIYGEVFYNFNLLGLFLLYILFYFFNKIYSLILNLLSSRNLNIKLYVSLFLYVTLIQFVRGSGLDLWFVYALVSNAIFIPFILIRKNYN